MQAMHNALVNGQAIDAKINQRKIRPDHHKFMIITKISFTALIIYYQPQFLYKQLFIRVFFPKAHYLTMVITKFLTSSNEQRNVLHLFQNN